MQSTEQHQDNRVTPQKPRQELVSKRFRPLVRIMRLNANSHFADEPVLVHWSALLPGGSPGGLSPHLLHIFQDHVAMTVEGFDSSEEFPIVAT